MRMSQEIRHHDEIFGESFVFDDLELGQSNIETFIIAQIAVATASGDVQATLGGNGLTQCVPALTGHYWWFAFNAVINSSLKTLRKFNSI